MILGIDPGSKRVGVAGADEETRLAHPIEVIETSDIDPVARIAEIAGEREATLIVVGRPTGLSGRPGPAAEESRVFVDRLRAEISVPVEEHDERLTTVMAERSLRATGAKAGTRKKARDAVAAQIMLQSFLDGRNEA